jgi:hypothetical protein
MGKIIKLKKRGPEIRKEKGQNKRARREEKAKERERLGEEVVPKQIPRTIENTQEPDDTFVHSDDDEVLADLGNDDMANYFTEEAAEPKILITTSPKAKLVRFFLIVLYFLIRLMTVF